MLFECLALWNDIQVYLEECWKLTKHSLRDWLGPGARKWYLTSDNQITHIPVHNSLIFCPIRNRIGTESQINSEQRGKRLQWLAVTIKNGEDMWDLSDWVSEIRIFSESFQASPSLLQIIRLACCIHNKYLFESPNTKIYITNRDGEDEIYVFQGIVILEKQEERK